ncbi:MAG: HPr family phosphocarrier protein [Anaeroplasmataceae bacterium]|nr:HPr family phosphocarrier protein [Anaeroplasmataceae bacterium]
MQKKKYRIILDQGLCVKPATELVNQAMKFHSEISLKVFQKLIDFKSLMGILSLGICGGTEIEVTADGHDEKEAISAITQKLIELNLAIEL